MEKALSSEEILAATIKGAKKYTQEYNCTLFKAFNDIISSQYHYVKGHMVNDEKKEMCDFQTYEDMIYSAAVEKTEMPRIYRWVLSNYYSFKALELDKEALEELFSQIILHRQYADNLRDKTAQLRLMLSNTPIGEAAECIGPLLEWWRSTKREESVCLYIDLFNLGYIEGKRAERKRKRPQQLPNV